MANRIRVERVYTPLPEGREWPSEEIEILFSGEIGHWPGLDRIRIVLEGGAVEVYPDGAVVYFPGGFQALDGVGEYLRRVD